MKKIFTIIIMVAFLQIFYSKLNAGEKIPAAVIDLVPQNVSSVVSATLSDTLRAELFNLGQHDVVDRSNMKEILAEQKFQKLGFCDDMGCIVEMGKLLGVRKMFTGTVARLGRKYIITLKIIDVQTAKVDNIRDAGVECEEEYLPTLLRDVLHGLVIKPEKISEETFQISGETKQYGRLKILTEPVGARVYLGAKEIGKTPYISGWIETGKHEVTVTYPGYATEILKIQVKQKEMTFDGVIELKRQRGNIRISSFPSDAKIFVGGEYKGNTEQGGKVIDSLPVGLHKVKIEKDKYFSEEKDVKVEYLQTTSVEINLKGKPGSLTVFSTPEGADVWIDEKWQGKTGNEIKDIIPGEHTIKIHKGGYEEKYINVRMEPAGSKTENIVLSRITEKRKIAKIKKQKQAMELKNRVSVGLSGPGIAARYNINNKLSLEARAQFASDIIVGGGRFYKNCSSEGAGVVFYWGGEFDYISFESDETIGTGYAGYGFLAIEIFLSDSISFLADVGPAYVNIATEEKDFLINNTHLIFNVGINFYLKL